MWYQINKSKRADVVSNTVSIIYKTSAAAATSTAPAALATLTAAPVNSDGRAEVGVTGEPPVGMTVVLYEPVAEGAGRLAPYEGLAPSWEMKLAQPMRVLLAKWRTNERLPK